MLSRKLLISTVSILIILTACGLAVAKYIHDCQHRLEEVDRYAVPFIVEVMKRTTTWKLDDLEPFMSDKYIGAFPREEWQKELDKLSVLGSLYSFGRPRFISHQPYTKYFICKSALDVYSIETEYENENAVVILKFNNKCGDLELTDIKVNSPLLTSDQDLSNENQDDYDEYEEGIDDLDAFEYQGLDDEEYEQIDTDKKVNKAAKPKSTNKPKGSIYRY